MVGDRKSGAESAPASPREPHRGHSIFAVCVAVALAVTVGFAGGMYLLPEPAPTAAAGPAADSVDVGFLQDMIVHHEQAVAMAGVATRASTDAMVRTFAYDVLTGQGAQIGRMQAWLDLWDRSRVPTGPYMGWMHTTGDHHPMAGMGAEDPAAAAVMPGMATPQELTTLAAASGPALDTMFLQLMLRHHQGGTDMLAAASARATQPLVRQFAESMLFLQNHETDVMRAMLAQRGTRPLPFP